MSAIAIGRIDALFRYPVKSMRGESLEAATLGWHGVDGDRRLALRRPDERGGFPWLTAGRLPDLLQFTPVRLDGALDDTAPARVRTPDGEALPTFGEALAEAVGRRHGAPVQMMRLNQGIFDDGSVSVIASGTVDEIGRLSGTTADVRRFRPNILVRTTRDVPFEEEDWVDAVLAFGDAADAPVVAVTMPDLRCGMVNLDPDGGGSAPAVLKAVVQANRNRAGVYGAVTGRGRLAVGQTVWLRRG